MRSSAWWAALVALVALAAVRARELDPAACSARFDVQRDKIIRTEESREMGARYLAELDVGSRAECLRLCCETDSCDVFVFEEKSPGSCYLFQCGPPEDFRCKFTAHGNFSSGVLALSRRLAELQDQERLARRDQLPGLRNPTSTSAAAVPVTPPLPTQPPTMLQTPQPARQPQRPEPAQQPQPAAPRPDQPPSPPRRCSRYQFECRRGGECIAVYNACDGVAQCADGSDEAPELGCPGPPTAAPRPPPHRPRPQVVQAAHNVQSAQGAQVVQGAQTVQGSQGELGEPAETDEEGGAGELWPRRLALAQHHYPGLEAGAGGSPHIFSHQGGLLQGAPFAPGWPRHAWPADPPHNDGEGADGAAGGWEGYSRLEPWPDERRAWPVPSRLEPEMAVVPAKTMPELPLYSGLQRQAALRDAPKKGYELVPPVAPATVAPQPPNVLEGRTETNPVVPKTSKKKELVTKQATAGAPSVASAAAGSGAGAAGGAAAHAAYAPWAEEPDGPSERPAAAVLLLVLGSLMTVSLGALLACRARAARRRRRGRPRLALDADYLVNGMYL